MDGTHHVGLSANSICNRLLSAIGSETDLFLRISPYISIIAHFSVPTKSTHQILYHLFLTLLGIHLFYLFNTMGSMGNSGSNP